MKIFKNVIYYIKGLLFFPYYIVKTYKNVKKLSQNSNNMGKLYKSRIPAIGHDFKDYILNNNMLEKIKNLKNSLDELSLKHVDFMLEAITNFPSSKFDDFFYNEDIKKYYPKWLLKEAEIAENTSKELWKEGFWGGYECVYYKHGIYLLPKKAQEYIKNKIFIDLGAFDGDSAYTLSKCEPLKILSFEISDKNIDKYKKNLKEKNVDNFEIFKIALSNRNGIMKFEDNGTWSDNLTKTGSQEVKIMTMDEFIKENKIQDKIGFIKADIESEEPNMINGALETIKKNRPVLALSIYHDPISFFEIKKTLEDLNLNYKFMIRVMGFYECGPINEANLIAYPAELD